MDRNRLAEMGVDHVYCLVLKGVYPAEYFKGVGDFGTPLTARDEAAADAWAREIDAREMLRRVEWLSGLPFEVVERPTRIEADLVDEYREWAASENTYDVPMDDETFNRLYPDAPGDMAAVRTERGTIRLVDCEPGTGPGHATEAIAIEQVAS